MNLFEAIFTNDSSSTAIIYGGREITYGELQDATIKTAKAIKLLGVVSGDRVALLLHDSPEFVQAFIALCSLGAIAVPVNMALRVDDQHSILHNSSARSVLVEADICNTVLTGSSEKLQHLRDIVVVDRNEDGPEVSPEYRTLQDLQLASAESEAPEFPIREPRQPAFLLYTSGSTGEPKGAIHRQAGHFLHKPNFLPGSAEPVESRSTVFVVATAVRLRTGKQFVVSVVEWCHLDSVSREANA